MQNNLIEIGMLIAGPLDEVDRLAVARALEMVAVDLRREFPDFQFRLQPANRPELVAGGRVEPSVLLQQAVEDRDALHWDFAFVVTAAELAGEYSTYCFAALSRPFDAAVISLSLIDPHTVDNEATQQERVERIARRLTRLMLHGLGHLNGLSPSDDPTNLLYHPSGASELDNVETFTDEQRERMRVSLAENADQRLEEGSGKALGNATFLARAAWINRREVAQAVLASRPWQFPRRLSRLTLASVSTVAVLFLTAESWDLGLSQSKSMIAILIALSLLVTTIHVVIRQQLLVRRGRRRSEQNVVTTLSALLTVFSGMVVTWCALSAIGLSLGYLLFQPELITSWAASNELREKDFDGGLTFQMSCFSASLGLMIGALGASFEEQNYFRHVIFVDEEI